VKLGEWIALIRAGVAGALALGPGQGLERIMSGPQQQGAILVQAQKWGGVFGIPSSWIMAISKIESNWRPGATNRTSPGDVKRGGAWGSMQVTLETAKGLAPRLQALGNDAVSLTLEKWDGTGESLLNVDVGIMFGAFLLSELSSQFGGDFDHVAAAYNRGAGNVKKMDAAGQPVTGLAYVQKAAAALEALA